MRRILICLAVVQGALAASADPVTKELLGNGGSVRHGGPHDTQADHDANTKLAFVFEVVRHGARAPIE